MTRYRELISGLKRGELFPLYLFSGEEDFLIQEATGLVVDAALDPGAREFNFAPVYCRETPAADLVNLCQTLPFLSSRRVVIAREIEAYKAGELELLAGYLRDPSPSTVLIMTSSPARFDKKAVVAPVEASGAVCVFYALLDREVADWIAGWARSRGLSIRQDAAQYLWQFVGNDLQKISNELQKTALSIGGRTVITYEDVKAAAGDFREFTSFDLADAVGRKKLDEAFLALARLIQEGEQPVGLIASMAWNFRRLLKAKAMEAAGAGPEEIKKKLKVIFHQSARFQEQLRRYSRDELRQALASLLAADRRLKSGGLPGRLVLERLILRLCGA